jgi:hypothetical protein
MLHLTCFHCDSAFERPVMPGALPRYCSDSCKAAVRAEARRIKAEDRMLARLEQYRNAREQFLSARYGGAAA